MNDRPIHRSATKEQQILIDEAEARGIARGIEMVAAWLDRKGQRMLAAELREAKVIERTDNGKA